MAKKRVGRGLDQLISNNLDIKIGEEAGIETVAKSHGPEMVRLSDVEPNKGQPRTVFDQDGLDELTESIRNYGIIEPLIVRQTGTTYEIIAGERRWRAARLAGLTEVPVIVRDYSDQEAYEVALIENIQRQNLNAIEEAVAYRKLMDEFDLKQEEVAKRISKSRAAVANTLRLLKLTDSVKGLVIEGKLSGGHARTLLGLNDSDRQEEVAKKVVDGGLSVRATEDLVRTLNEPAPEKEENNRKEELFRENKAEIAHMEEALKAVLGTKVSIKSRSGDKGKIQIEYYSKEELDRILSQLGVRF